MPGTERPAGLVPFTAAALLTGVGAGLGGALLTFVLGAVERLWFGAAHAPGPDAAVLAPVALRSTAVVVAGVVTAGAWFLLRRHRVPLTVPQAVKGARMTIPTTVLNALVQVVNVGSGASIGREAAPRELGSLAGDRLSALLGLSARQRQVLVAAGAGAGVAAIYDVPLAGILFALEILLAPAVADAVLPTIAVVTTAVVVAHVVGVPPGPLYHLPIAPWGPGLVALAAVLGPVLGAAGAAFAAVADRLAALSRRRPWAVLVLLPIASAVTAAVAVALPRVLGNGQAISQVALTGTLALGTAALLAVAKAATTLGTIGSGAAGGRLNPSFAVGASAGVAAGGAASLAVAGVPATGAGLVGAAAFLGAVQRSPLTAVALAVEFTDNGARFLFPVLVGVVGSAAATALVDRARRRAGNAPRRGTPTEDAG